MKLQRNKSSVQAVCLDEKTQTNHVQQVKSFILNHGSHVIWLRNASLFIAIAVDTSEMPFFQNRGLLSVCLPACLSVCLSVLLMNKTSTNS